MDLRRQPERADDGDRSLRVRLQRCFARSSGRITPLMMVALLHASQAGVSAQCGFDIEIIQAPPCHYGPPTTRGRGINAIGDVVGDRVVCSQPDEAAFIWTEATGFHTLAFPPGATDSHAHDVNNLGVVVGRVDYPSDGAMRGFVHGPGGVSFIGPPGPLGVAEAYAINDRGQVTGYWTDPSRNGAFLWQDGVMTDLSEIIGAPESRAFAINERGQIAGWMGVSDITDARAFVLDADRLTILPPVPDGTTSEAHAINDRGDVAGFGWIESPLAGKIEKVGFAWIDGVMHRIDPVPGFQRATARSINDAGFVVGDSKGYGWLWHRGVMMDLNDLPPDGASQILTAWSINGALQIVAWGLTPTGAAALRLTPAESVSGDVDCDSRVNAKDLALLIEAWGSCFQPPPVCAGDFDRDGFVGIQDLLALLASWTN